MEVMKANDPFLMRTMELAVQFGRWVLIENVGIELDQALEPIIQVSYQAGFLYDNSYRR